MTERIEVVYDIDRELDKIEDDIETHNRLIENLVWRRSELLIQKQDLEMYELIDCIIEKGLSANEALGIINSVRVQ